MRNAFSFSLLTGLLALAGCSSGTADDPTSVRINCLGGQSFCIISCDLGCSQSGCSVSEVAENQRVRFKFSDRVDPASVSASSLSIRTATGVAPDGDYLVTSSEVTFVPKVRTVNGVSTFGFLRNESYIISLAGGNTAAQGIRNLAGDTLSQEFTCTVRASLGIRDEDQQAPSVALIAPASTTGVPLDPTIVLRFSELIDTTALMSPLSQSSPIRVVLRGTLAGGACDRDAEGIALEGLPQLSTERVGERETTVVTFRPTVQFPGSSCMTIYVTSDLRDLSGRAAVPAQFELLTVAGVSVPILLTEGFATPAGQEELVSGGVWSGANGGAKPGLIGSDGRHGSFLPSLGTAQGGGVFVWNTDSTLIPAGNTPSGQAFLVTDGRFFFTDFVLADGQTLKFTGSVAPQFFVRGQAEIRGIIDVSGVDLPANVPLTGPLANQRVSAFNARGTPSTVQVLGQVGGLGGVGGGNGGDGGRECAGLGPILVNAVNVTNGQAGQTVRVLAGHAYAGLAGGTGGPGSDLNPANGLTASAQAPFIPGLVTFRDEFSRGGSGGGFMFGGGLAATPTINGGIGAQPANGPIPAVSVAFPLLPYPLSPPVGYSSLNHFVVGGSGGGGGGSHTFGIPTINADIFCAGQAGSGGGGAFAIRCGGDLTVFGTAQLLVRGGRGVVINGDGPVTGNDIDWGVSSPGGGGSGGSMLLQSARTLTVSGLIDASGGLGSRVSNVSSNLAPTQIAVIVQAGGGSSGFYRLEAGTTVNWNGSVATVPAFDAGVNVGPLEDRDGASGDLSKWRGTGLIFPPTWERYELDVDTNGDGIIDITYTDTGAVGTQKANDPAGPVMIQFQGAKLNQTGTVPIEGTIKAWRDGIGIGAGPGIQQDSVTGFRFSLLYNRSAFPDQVVKALRVFART